MTSYGGPSLRPESPAHGSQRVYLGQMAKGLMVNPGPLVSRKISGMGCYGGPYMRRIIHLATGGVCWPRVGPGGESQSAKYAALPTTHVFQPVAIETLGPLDPSACDFINQIGSRMSVITGARRETPFLFQRLSMAI